MARILDCSNTTDARWVWYVPGSNWVDPPKRERKRVVNYAENEYFRQAMKSGTGGRGAGGIKLPKLPPIQVEHQALYISLRSYL